MAVPGCVLPKGVTGSSNDWTTNASALLTSQSQQAEFNSAEVSRLTVGLVVLQSL